MDDDDVAKIDLAAFNEDILEEHQEKVAIIMGLFFGFRGQNEHRNLKSSHFKSGVYPPNHCLFPNCKYTALICIPNDKKRSLSLKSLYVRENADELGMFPHLSDMSIDVGGALHRYLMKLPNNTSSFQGDRDTFYCHLKVGRGGQLFFQNTYLGSTSICKLVRSATAV